MSRVPNAVSGTQKTTLACERLTTTIANGNSRRWRASAHIQHTHTQWWKNHYAQQNYLDVAHVEQRFTCFCRLNSPAFRRVGNGTLYATMRGNKQGKSIKHKCEKTDKAVRGRTTQSVQNGQLPRETQTLKTNKQSQGGRGDTAPPLSIVDGVFLRRYQRAQRVVGVFQLNFFS